MAMPHPFYTFAPSRLHARFRHTEKTSRLLVSWLTALNAPFALQTTVSKGHVAVDFLCGGI